VVEDRLPRTIGVAGRYVDAVLVLPELAVMLIKSDMEESVMKGHDKFSIKRAHLGGTLHGKD
jgi:hypothetical protein